MKKQSCIICGKSLNNGIMIYGRGICKCCEERLVSLDDTTDFYNYYMERIRKAIVQDIIRGEEISCRSYRF
ncbi:sigma factor G inhibitor Gin [Clostridium aciditolerans]|uniref:Sigma factor G inhibitor Gin n=1 Tax=Clostridium aciditolerans TaxID=339861 RepID=A0A934HRJ4_9CLOT|nr:sigma factor G inhibitor Gin [Clostridium aciditolerans]MBI6873171.1 sigma factor G inhibitor Gin [Clostridium aciditolerans]